MVNKIQKKPASKKIPINITKITEQKLIDEKLRKAAANPSQMPKVVATAAALGFLVGAVILAYYFFIKSPTMESQSPEITLPQDMINQEDVIESNPPPATAPPSMAVAKAQVEILETPTGFLNVRSGPGTSNTKVGEVKPGDLFAWVSSDIERGWYEIRLTATSTGWVTKQYSRIIDNQ
ncbi:MAG: SH3 domain-containing protein [bacterium]|nr:SH3 domain-containing protein [bacterium]